MIANWYFWLIITLILVELFLIMWASSHSSSLEYISFLAVKHLAHKMGWQKQIRQYLLAKREPYIHIYALLIVSNEVYDTTAVFTLSTASLYKHICLFIIQKYLSFPSFFIFGRSYLNSLVHNSYATYIYIFIYIKYYRYKKSVVATHNEYWWSPSMYWWAPSMHRWPPSVHWQVPSISMATQHEMTTT